MLRVLTVGTRYPVDADDLGQAAWRELVDALRARGDTVSVLSTEDDEAAPQEGVDRTLRWFWSPGGWRRPARLESSRIARHDLRVLGDLLQAFRPDVVVWSAMTGLPLTLVGASGLPELALVGDAWPIQGPGVDPVTRRDGWDPGAVTAWSCADDALRTACVQALPDVPDDRFAVEAGTPVLLRRLDTLAIAPTT